MFGSRQGWREAPYVSCPAEPAALARGLVSAALPDGGAMQIVPGVSHVDEDGVPDVMRGEETQIAGLPVQPGRRFVVLPGTHSKWALCEGETLVRFASFMTGEVFAVMAQHSILGRLFVGEGIDADGFARGLAHASRAPERQGGLLHRLFSARTLGLFEAMPAASLRGYLSGLLIGSEIAEAIALFGGAPPDKVTIVGSGALTGLYEQGLRARGVSVEPAPPDAALAGLMRIAQAARLIS
jgi:2-dehydro-3-deoxygalactonokinase